MVAAALASVATSGILKLFSAELAILTMLALRFTFGIPLIALAAWIKRRRRMFAINRVGRVLWRIGIGHVNIMLWVGSIAYTGLGQATALFQSSAIFVTILAPLILKERVGILRGGAVLVGVSGIYLICDPLAGGFNIGTVLGLASSVTGAAMVIYLRLLGRTEEPVSLVLWHNISGCVLYPLLLLILGGFADYAFGVREYLPLLLVLGALASVMQIGLTTAYRHGEAMAVMPVRYLSVPLSGVVGWWFWGEVLSASQISGMAIVVASCIFIAFREYMSGRRARQAAAI